MISKEYALNVAVTAMHILDGVEANKHWDELQPVWEHRGLGFVEFTRWLADFAFESEDALWDKEQDFPGVYDYEVSYVLGCRIREHMIETSYLPNDQLVSKWLKELADAFFKQGEA